MRPDRLTAAVTLSLLAAAVGPALAQTVGPAGVAPATAPVGAGTPVTITAVITDPAVLPTSVQVQRYDSQGRVVGVFGLLRDDGLDGDAIAGDRTFTRRQTIYELTPGPITLRVSAAFRGRVVRVLSPPFTLNITGTPSTVSITTPTNLDYRNVSPILVSGTVGDPSAQVRINGLDAAVTGNTFTAQVPILEGTNTLTAVAANSNGTVTTASVQITLDTTPPRISINAPDATATTSAAAIAVGGIVNDIVVGTVNPLQSTVTVNGVAAQVSNRSFLAPSVPLALGPNTIQATATDRGGNSATASVVVTRVAPAGAIAVVSGNNQTAPAGSLLPQPLVARVTNASGQPVAGAPIVFRVVENSGGLVSGTASLGSLPVVSDAQGQASVSFRLGTRAGAGNHVVEATATGFAGTATFTQSATATAPRHIVVDTGNGQIGAVGQPLALPFVAIVTDAGHNRIGSVPVTFTVKEGGGTLGGVATRTATTDPDGRAAVVLTLGQQEGQDNNVVEATFPANPTRPAAFLATARVPANPAATRITGVALDNANTPIPGVTMRLFRTHQGPGVPEQVVTPVTTGETGQFTIDGAPVGAFKLMADGSTAPNGPWPTLEFDVVTVSGQTIDVGLPIYLPVLDAVNRLCVSETTGGTLTLPDVPGFALTLAPGAATFPGGSRTGCVSVTPVNGDKVPMSPGFGQQPRFVVTIQPVGTVFNPAARLTLPNVDGLAPRQVTEMYSYDHDLAAFVSIGTGTVSDDGSVITSDPGVGVIKAGWHCGGNPNPTGSVATCADCQRCELTQCVPDTSLNGQSPADNRCVVCQSGVASPIPVSEVRESRSFTFTPPSEVVDTVNESLERLRTFGTFAEVSLASLTAAVETRRCCGPAVGLGDITEGSVSGDLASISLDFRVWPAPLAPFPSLSVGPFNVGIVEFEINATVAGGIFVGIEGAVSGQLGYRQSTCESDAALRLGCPFGGFDVTLTPSVAARAVAQAELGFSCEGCDGASASLDVSLTAGQLSWPLHVAQITVNADQCGQGVSGGQMTFGPGAFEVSARAAGSLDVPSIGTFSFDFTNTFLRCEITLDGVTCAP